MGKVNLFPSWLHISLLIFDKLVAITSLSKMGLMRWFGIDLMLRKLSPPRERVQESLSRFQAGDFKLLLVHETVQTVCIEHSVKGLILAQNERWRRGLGMQVERIPFG